MDPIDLDVRQFAKHVNKVGPERAFMDFLYGMFVVADEVLRQSPLRQSPLKNTGSVKPPLKTRKHQAAQKEKDRG